MENVTSCYFMEHGRNGALLNVPFVSRTGCTFDLLMSSNKETLWTITI